MKPTIGRIVLVRFQHEPDREYAAIVSRVWGDSESACINAHVFCDGGVSVSTSIAHASQQGASVTWDWPPRV
jgi:hypothetical protein